MSIRFRQQDKSLTINFNPEQSTVKKISGGTALDVLKIVNNMGEGINTLQLPKVTKWGDVTGKAILDKIRSTCEERQVTITYK